MDEPKVYEGKYLGIDSLGTELYEPDYCFADEVKLYIEEAQAEIDRLNHAINDEAVFGDHNIIPSMQAEIDGLTTRLNLLEEFCEKVQVHLPTMAKADLHHYFNTFGRLNQEKE